MMLPTVARNVGRDHHQAPVETWEERCQSLADENRQLKLTRNEQAQTIKDLNAQFARLKRDLKIGTPRSAISDGVDLDDGKQVKALQAKLTHVTKQRDDLGHEVAELKEKLKRFKAYEKNAAVPSVHARHTHGGAIAPGGTIHVTDLLDPHLKGALRPQSAESPQRLMLGAKDPNAASFAALLDERQRDRQRMQELAAERDNLRAQLQIASIGAFPASRPDERSQALERRNAALENEVNALHERYASVSAMLETASLDRDRLATELSIARAGGAAGPTSHGSHGASSPQHDHQHHHAPHATLRFDSIRDAPNTDASPHRHGHGGHGAQPHYSATNTRGTTPPTLQHQSSSPFLSSLPPTSRPPVDPFEMSTGTGTRLRQTITEQQAQVTVLAGRFEDAQAHARTLQQECERLVGELRAMHTTLGEEKRRNFQLEHEKATLMVKAGRTEELELAVSLKSEELIRCEQELLRMVDRLQSCSRETESQVRLEMNSRLIEAEQMREEADRQRRAREREIFGLQTEASDLRTQLARAREDATHFKSQMESISSDRAEIAAKYAAQLASGPVDPKAAEEVVGRLMAATTTARGRSDVDTLRDGAAWDDNWELAKLRELVSSQTLDLELAESRAAAFDRDLKMKNDALTACLAQRDELLNENLRLREQLTGIQTALHRRDRAVIEEQAGRPAELTLQVDHISCSDAALRMPTVDDAIPTDQPIPALLFVSMEGIADFEPAVSDITQVTQGEVTLPFRFAGLPVNSDAALALARDTVVLQLHRSLGMGSRIVASGDVKLGTLLARCLEDAGDATVLVPLMDSSASRCAELTIRITVSQVALLLAAVPAVANKLSNGPLVAMSSPASSASALTAWLFAFRAVTRIRIHVSRCRGLGSSTSGVPPTPYVFVTATGYGGASPPIRDTVVHTRGVATMSADPIFDGEPTDHPITISAMLHDFISQGAVTFVVFDSAKQDTESNLGSVTVPLAPLLASPTATIVETKPLHPSGTIDYTVSWVR